MAEEFTIVFAEEPAWDEIGGGINAHNKQYGGEEHFQRLCYVVKDAAGAVVGGVIGEMYWGWLFVNLMWLRADLRGRGYGHQLLERIEAEARQRGAKQVYLDTFSFQAPDFYKQHGYRVFGELKDFPPGHTRFFMTKEL